MRNVIEWFIQAAFGLFCLYMGYRAGRKDYKPQEKDSSVCSCAHQYSMHNDKGVCNVHKIKKINHREAQIRCACTRYDGIPPAHVYMKDV